MRIFHNHKKIIILSYPSLRKPSSILLWSEFIADYARHKETQNGCCIFWNMISEQEHCYFRCTAVKLIYCNLVMSRYRLKNQSVNLAHLQVSQVRLSRKLSCVNAPRAARSISHFIRFPHRIPNSLCSLRSLKRRTWSKSSLYKNYIYI